MSNDYIDRIAEAHAELIAHYLSCEQCSRCLNYHIASFCCDGEQLHKQWESEFYNKENWL